MTITTFKTLIDLNDEIIKEEKLVIPEFQRGFAWKINNVCELFDSVFSGYPIGAILVWSPKELELHYRHIRNETNNGNVTFKKHEICKFHCGHPPEDYKSDNKTYILDGQQRIRSLYYGLYFSCHQEIFKPNRTKKDSFTFLLKSTNNNKNHNTVHINSIFKNSKVIENSLILKKISISRIDNKQYQESIKVVFNKLKNGDKSLFENIFEIEFIVENDTINSILFYENGNQNTITEEQLETLFREFNTSLIISTFPELLIEKNNVSIWNRFYSIFLRTSIYARKLDKPKQNIINKLYDVSLDFFDWIDRKGKKLLQSSLARIQTDGPLTEMVNIFDKLNMTGVRLSTLDLISAKTYQIKPYQFYLKKILNNLFSDPMYSAFFSPSKSSMTDLDFLLILKIIGLIEKKDLRDTTILELNIDTLHNILVTKKDLFMKAVDSTIEFFNNIPRVKSMDFVRYDLLFPIIAAIFYFIHKNYNISEINIETNIRDYILAPWYWRIIFPNKFGTSPKENARQQYKELIQLIDKACKLDQKNFQSLLQPIYEELDIITKDYKLPDYDDLSDLPDGRNITPLNILSYSKSGSVPNLKNGNYFDLTVLRKDVHVHHIFPKGNSKLSNIRKFLIDNPINMMVIDSGMNTKIKNKLPFEYITDFRKASNLVDYDQILVDNLLPIFNEKNDKYIIDDKSFDKNEISSAYDYFLRRRAEIIIDKIKILQFRGSNRDISKSLSVLSNHSEIDQVNFNIEKNLSEDTLFSFDIEKDEFKEFLHPKSHVYNALKIELIEKNLANRYVEVLRNFIAHILVSSLSKVPDAKSYRKFWLDNYQFDVDEILPTEIIIGTKTLYKRILKNTNHKSSNEFIDYLKNVTRYIIIQIAKYSNEKCNQEARKTLLLKDFPQNNYSEILKGQN